VGRPWLAYWLLPYPNQRGLWPNFRSPLLWDVFAVSTYFTVSALFFLIGMIPDIAAARDATTIPWRKKLYTMLAFGWRGTEREWRHFTKAYLYLAALATPLVLSVHSVVSWDFAMSIVPGWHTTIFAPYVAGAIFRAGAGDHPGDPDPQGVRARGVLHAAPLRCHGQAGAGHQHDRVIRLPDRVLHGVVQLRGAGARHLLEPCHR
jgi:hypothetical protein